MRFSQDVFPLAFSPYSWISGMGITSKKKLATKKTENKTFSEADEK